MKKLLVAMMIILLALTACTAEGTTVEETAVPPTEVSLEPAPTATDAPTAEPTATTEPEPTDTAEPEPTDTADPYPAATDLPPQEEAPSEFPGTFPEDFEMPEGAVIVFTQMGGFAGFDDTWVFYADGRVTKNDVLNRTLTPDETMGLVDDLEALNFFDTSYSTKPGTICCDFFDYTLAVMADGQQNYVSFSDGDQNLPDNLRESSVLLLNIINGAQ